MTEQPHETRDHLGYQRLWRLSSLLHHKGLKRASRAAEIAFRVRYSADVPPNLALRDDVVLMHNALGVVIHARTEFRGPALVFQHATIGRSERGGPPSIGARVVIGAGACILGPVRVGDDCVVGANSVLTGDLPDGHRFTGKDKVSPVDHAFIRAQFKGPSEPGLNLQASAQRAAAVEPVELQSSLDRRDPGFIEEAG